MTALNLKHGMVLALDNPRKTTRKNGATPDGKQLKPIRFDNGEPVYRFRVQAIPGGKFLTADGAPFEVTNKTLNHWQNTFKAFANRGIPVPVLTGTHLEPTAEHAVGQVVGVDVKNGSLWCTCELVGKDVPRLAATNSVSIYAEPSWTDAKGNSYEWPLRHLLMTPDPRIPGLQGFVPLAASNGKIFNVPVLRYLRLANLEDRERFEKEATVPVAKFKRNLDRQTGKEPMATKSRLPHIALDELGTQNEDGLGTPGVGDGGMLPGGPGDQGSTAGDINAGPEAGKEGLKQQIKNHFIDHAHTVLDDDQMEHTEKLEAMKELLSECEKILEAFTDEEDQETENQDEEVADDHDQGEEPEYEEGSRGAAMANEDGEPEMSGSGPYKDGGKKRGSEAEKEDKFLMSNDDEPGTDEGVSSAMKVGKAVLPVITACLNNMPQMRQTLGPKDAQLAQLTSRLRRQEIQALWLSGKITPAQKKQLEKDFLAPQHVALSLSNATFGNSFDQAISLLASNEAYGEQTGPQGGLALTNEYNRTQAEADQAEKDEKEYIKPSAQRVSKNGKK